MEIRVSPVSHMDYNIIAYSKKVNDSRCLTGDRSPRKKRKHVADASSALRVARAIEIIRNICDGNLETNQLLIKRKLTSRDYEQLLAQVAKEQSLQDYFKDKLR